MKPWYESKTLWFNIAGCFAVVLQYLGIINFADEKVTEAILIVGNVLLRFKTNTGIK